MSIRSTLLAAAFTLASLGAAHANGLRPIEGRSIDLGDVSGARRGRSVPFGVGGIRKTEQHSDPDRSLGVEAKSGEQKQSSDYFAHREA